MLDRHKVQRIASERMALSRRCLSCHDCILCHRLHHSDALLMLDTPGLPFNSKNGPVRQQRQQKLVKFFFFFFRFATPFPPLIPVTSLVGECYAGELVKGLQHLVPQFDQASERGASVLLQVCEQSTLPSHRYLDCL